MSGKNEEREGEKEEASKLSEFPEERTWFFVVSVKEYDGRPNVVLILSVTRELWSFLNFRLPDEFFKLFNRFS